MGSGFPLDSLSEYRELTATKIGEAERHSSFLYPEFAIDDVHLASGCLQKALRRGDRTFAQASAQYLAKYDPDRLWRRLVVCAFEDVGLADLTIVSQVVAAVMSNSFRLRVGVVQTRHFLVDQ